MLAAPVIAAFLCIAAEAVATEAGPPRPLARCAKPDESPRTVDATRAILRAANCDRCHGKDYEGLSAPSILAYVRTQTREAFARVVLDGDVERGMPGYRGHAYVADHVDEFYDYFAAHAAEARLPACPD